VGEWNAADFDRYVHAIPLSDYRDVARQLSTKLEQSVDAELNKAQRNQVAAGPAFDKQMDHTHTRRVEVPIR